ncbi:MAG: hypothetical protein EBZ87_06650 [Microbacteriaceae bacterium]|nr:hypothetical protein [Microbacteriaceae bacterium]
MTLTELIDRLTAIQEEHGDIEVLAAFQPNYPLITDVQAITTVIAGDDTTLYIAVGDGDAYGSKNLWSDDEIEVCADCESDDCECDDE